MIKLDDDLVHTINVDVLKAIDRAMSDAAAVEERIWITDVMLPEFLPHLERLVRKAAASEELQL